MSISTSYKYESANSKVNGSNTSTCFEPDSIKVYVSDAEGKVIANKAKKAGLSLSEYMRYAALGFPLS